MKSKLIILGLITYLLTGCAIYDSKNGPLVTSSPVTVVSADYPKNFSLKVEPFIVKADDTGGGTVNTEFGLVNNVAFDINHEYIFNKTDQENIYISTLQSLEASGVKIEPKAPISIAVVFDYVGMRKASYGYVIPTFRGTIILTSNEETTSQPFVVHGEERMTVKGSKESGIEKVVKQIHKALQSSL